jgi:hypothetical protein
MLLQVRLKITAGLNLAHSQFYQPYCKYLYTHTHMHIYLFLFLLYDQYIRIINTAVHSMQIE